jgi:uncharacterized protein YcbK (DUF882 family)
MLAVILATSLVGAAEGRATTSKTERKTPARRARVLQPSKRAIARPAKRPAAASARRATDWAASLRPIEVKNRNTRAHGKVLLYKSDGSLDPEAVREFVAIARSANAREPDDEPLDPRLVQLVVRASYHFGGKTISIVSATRKGKRGKHGSGEAIDFALEGVRARTLARHLFGYPLAGVGFYTHPKTQYVHLDVRDRGTHWLDGSPPGVTWREKLLADPKQAARDASYVAAMDLPEGAGARRPPGTASSKRASPK